MTTEEITEAFSLLRETCDPRGHGVLRALENLCLVETVALDALLEALAEQQKLRSNVVSMIDKYSVRA